MKSSSLEADLGWLYLFAKETSENNLAVEKSPETLDRLTSRLEKLAEKEINTIHAKIAALGEAGKHLTPACQKGCWHCCTHLVTASVPEVLRIANVIRESWTTEEIDALKERIAVHKEAIKPAKGTPQNTWPRHACPLLQDGACSVWKDRPFVCRGWNSLDVQPCIEKERNPQSGVREQGLAHQVAVTDYILQGYEAALASARVNADLCELSHALDIALNKPDAAARYLNGDNLFAPAQEIIK